MRNWWKFVAIILLVFSLIGGFLVEVPRQVILYESIRNLYFHVPMWFSMTLLFLASVIYSIMGLASGKIEHDKKAEALVNTGIVFGVLGLTTGSLWAKYTWGTW